MLPLVPRFATKVVNRSGSQLGGGTIEASSAAPAKSHCRGGTERDADNVLEHRTITMPADPGAGIVPNEQRLNQILRGYMCEPRRLRTQRQQPRGYPDADDLDDLRGDPAFWGSNQSCACKERIARGVKCLPDHRRPEWLRDVIRLRQIGGKVREYDRDSCVQRSVRGDADHR